MTRLPGKDLEMLTRSIAEIVVSLLEPQLAVLVENAYSLGQRNAISAASRKRSRQGHAKHDLEREVFEKAWDQELTRYGIGGRKTQIECAKSIRKKYGLTVKIKTIQNWMSE